MIFLAFSFLVLALIPTANQDASYCGCEDQPYLDVLAIVHDQKITKRELNPDTQSRVSLLQDTVVQARYKELDRLINSLLLEAEAKRRGLTPTQLLRVEVQGRFSEPTESEAKEFYDRNKERMSQDYKGIKNNILAHMRAERETMRALEFSNQLRAAAKVQVHNPNVTAPVNEADFARVFATVNGTSITSFDIEKSLLPLIFRVQEQVYNIRKADLDLRINDILLEAESKKQGVPPLALIAKEVRPKLSIITEAQALAFYNKNKGSLSGEFNKLKPQIFQYLQAEDERRLTLAYAEKLRIQAGVEVFLKAPEPPAFEISINDQPTKGNPKAAVTVVQFTDFECASCARTYASLERLIGEFGGQVQFVVRDFPLSQHANALRAAEAAEAARDQGKYWEYAAVLFKNQHDLGANKLREYAAAVGLDPVKFAEALDGGPVTDQVQRDMADGAKLGIDSSPVFFVNGKRVADYSYEGLKTAIQAALNVR